MADPSKIDAAVIAKLKANASLVTWATDGFFFDLAKPGATKFVIVSLIIGEDEDAFGETDPAIQTNLYLVKAVEKNTAPANVLSGAALIHTALQKQALSIDGYSHMATRRIERVRYPEVDEDTDERWQHAGGRYEVMASSNG